MTDDLLTPETIQQRFRTAECDCRVFADGITIQTVCVECRELVDALLRYGAQCAREAQQERAKRLREAFDALLIAEVKAFGGIPTALEEHYVLRNEIADFLRWADAAE